MTGGIASTASMKWTDATYNYTRLNADYYYDEKNNCLGLFVCDVSGHGIYAAFLSSMVKTALHDWSDFIKEPAIGLKRLRDILVATIKEQFITAIMCCVELDSGKINSG